MQINIRTLLFLLTLTIISCSKEVETLRQHAPVTVTIGSTPQIDIESRSTLDPDGVTVRWAKGDQIAVWSRNGAGEYEFSAQPFVLWHFSETFDNAKFTATIAPMPEGKYDYLALSPIPQSVNGTQATYSVPLLQTGVYNSDYDIRVATPSLGKSPLTEGDNSASVNFAFAHKVHMLRIRIPENKLGEPITELELTFPKEVVGKLTVDAADPDAAPVLTEGWNKLTIVPKTPLQAGDIVTVFIAPVEIPNTEAIEIRAYGETCCALPAYMPGKNFAAGRTTPIALTIPSKERDYASIELSLTGMGAETLGEDITLFKISGPYDCNLGNGSSERLFFVKEADAVYTFFLGRHFDPLNNLISGQTFKATYESENAVVTNSFVMPQLIDGQPTTTPALTVPCLLEEDFSQAKSFNNHDNTGGGTTSDKYIDAIALDSHGLPGWSGTRCGAEEGNAFRICARTEDAFFLGVSRYHGRLDTPPIPIKPGKTIQVSVSFDYSINISWDAHKPLVAYGYHTTQGQINSINNGSTALIDPIAKDITGSGGSYSSITQKASYTIPACTNMHRLAWDIYSANRKTGNSNGWLYLDNIKVSIAK